MQRDRRSIPMRSTLVVLAAILLAVALGAVSPQPASAATARLLLTSGLCEPGFQQLRVEGTTNIVAPNGRRMIAHFWGEDTFSDDHLLGPLVRNLGPSNQPGAFYREDFCIDFETLDEDLGVDDIYLWLTFTPVGQSSPIESVRTNTIHVSF